MAAKMFSETTLIMIIGTFNSFLCIFGIWLVSMIIMRLGGATLKTSTEYIFLAIPAILIVVFNLLIIVKIIKISSGAIIIGYFILAIGVWVIIWISVIVWYASYEMRNNILFERITKKGELIIDFYDMDHAYKAYYMKNKVYYIEIGKQYRYGNLIWVYHKIKNIDTDIYYSNLYEKSNKFTLLIKKEHYRNNNDADYHLPNCIIYLHGIGSFKFNWLDNMITENFDSLKLIILNEEIHAKFMEKLK